MTVYYYYVISAELSRLRYCATPPRKNPVDFIRVKCVRGRIYLFSTRERGGLSRVGGAYTTFVPRNLISDLAAGA